jgi:hypothetical protein
VTDCSGRIRIGQSSFNHSGQGQLAQDFIVGAVVWLVLENLCNLFFGGWHCHLSAVDPHTKRYQNNGKALDLQAVSRCLDVGLNELESAAGCRFYSRYVAQTTRHFLGLELDNGSDRMKGYG